MKCTLLLAVMILMAAGCIARPRRADRLNYTSQTLSATPGNFSTTVHAIQYSPAELIQTPSRMDRPLTVRDPVEPNYIDLSLDEAISLALQNSELVQTNSASGSAALVAPDQGSQW